MHKIDELPEFISCYQIHLTFIAQTWLKEFVYEKNNWYF